MDSWDPVAFKALLRTTSQRLGQLQERKDAQGQLTRRAIATCLAQGHVALARAKAATLIQEDVMGDLMEELEMMVGVLGSRVGELGTGLGMWADTDPTVVSEAERVGKLPRMSPVLVEAAASIIHAAPGTESKDLNAVREGLMQRLGPGFTQMASGTRNNHVSPRIMQLLASPPPTASKMDEYLVDIAQTYGVKWVPELRREDLPNVISEILRVDTDSPPIVDLPRLRAICARGLPDDPPWIRPRIWRLLFGTLPVLKTTWVKENQKQRNSYYDLVRRLLTPLASLPPPTNPLSPDDAILARISESLFRVSPDLFVLLGNEPKSIHLGKCPLDPTAPDTIHIACASNLDARLALLKGDDDTSETPEIRLESDLNGNFDPTSSPPTLASRRQRRPTTLLPSKAYNAPPAHRGHLSALLRLLYIHNYIHNSSNPVVQSPHIPWLLVPLYSALIGETEEDEVAHAEADTFWVFEALVGEVAEMEEEDGGKVWSRKLSEQIKWADPELAARLHTTGLDPALPHYSYRWLAPLLAQTLPLSSVFPVWDLIFAGPTRTRDANPKLEHLVDICTALLVRARTPLFRLGKPARNAPGFWSQEQAALSPPSPLRPWELSDAFTEGVALLTSYPIDAAGGIDRVLQTASDLAQKRVMREKERVRENVGFGARMKQRMWEGFTNQVADASPEGEEEEEEEETESDSEEVDEAGEHDDGNETETPAVPTLTSRLANTVWRGITNQSSMDDEVPSPPSPSSTIEEQDIQKPSDMVPSTSSSQARLWDYAGKLKDSDTVAAFAKASTNWRAKALDAWRVRKENNASSTAPAVPVPMSPPPSATSEVAALKSGWPGLSGADTPSHRRGSLPGTQRESEHAALDPPRPAFFRSPRESFLPQPRRQHAAEPSSPRVDAGALPMRDSDNESSTASFIHRAGASLASLAQFPSVSAQSTQSTPKSIPRPLMLSSRDLIMTKPLQPQPYSRSEGGTPPTEYRGQWADVALAAKNRQGRLASTSISSTSSLSPSEAMNRSPYSVSGGLYARSVGSVGTGPRSDHESDEAGVVMTSRKVPLNRKSVSPMALASRSPRLPWNVSLPGGRSPGSGAGHPLSNGSVMTPETDLASERGWKHVEEQVRSGASTAMTGTTGSVTTGLDSPTTIGSPPIPRTPVVPAVSGPGVRIVNEGHTGTSSISTLSEVNLVPLEPVPTMRKKTSVVALRDTGPCDEETSEPASGSDLESEVEESEMSLEQTPSGKAPVRVRTKRYVSRPGTLRLRPSATGLSDQRMRTPSPRRQSAQSVQSAVLDDLATTPKMENYSGVAHDGVDEEELDGVLGSRPPFVRKPSKETRVPKIATGNRDMRRARESGAEEGDDEGYDELLSAYESEEGSRE